jgi:hypothetical protein
MRRGQTTAAARRTTYLFNRRFHADSSTQYPWCSRSLCWVGGVWEYAITKCQNWSKICSMSTEQKALCWATDLTSEEHDTLSH